MPNRRPSSSHDADDGGLLFFALKNITIEKPTDGDHGKNTIAKMDKTLFEIY